MLSTAKVAQVKAGKQVFFFRFLEFGVISFEYREIGERYARHVSNKENLKKEGKTGVSSGCLTSVSYRSNTGKERKKKSREI